MESDAESKGLYETILVRVFPEDKQTLQNMVKNNPKKYECVSHAVRCAIQRLIRENK